MSENKVLAAAMLVNLLKKYTVYRLFATKPVNFYTLFKQKLSLSFTVSFLAILLDFNTPPMYTVTD